MWRTRHQGSLEYIILIGGIIILAAASYFMLKGFSQTTTGETTQNIGVIGDKYRMELENLGRSQTKFYARRWLNPSLTTLTKQTFDSLEDVTYNLTNLSAHGVNTSTLEFAFFDRTSFNTLNYSISGEFLAVNTSSYPSGKDFILYMFYNNSSSLINPCLANYTGPALITCETFGLPDHDLPLVSISATAFGSAGSVKNADIVVTVNGTGSNVSEVYYSIEGSAWFPADNMYYQQGSVLVEAHPSDLSYDNESETIHIIATVPEEGNYTVRVLSRDEYWNEVQEEEIVSIMIAGEETAPPCTLTAFANGSSQLNMSFPEAGSNDSAKIELPLDANVLNASMNVTGLGIADNASFNLTGNYSLESSGEIHVADFDDDGNPDFVATFSYFSIDAFAYFEGYGDGTFGNTVNYSIGGSSGGVYSGHFNNDGDLDLVVTRDLSSEVLIFIGNGDGTFVNTNNYTTGHRSKPAFVADFSNDGNEDIVVTNYYYSGPTTFSYLAGNGDGTFNSSVDYPVGGKTHGIYGGDFNEDGNMDVIAGIYDSNGFAYVPGNGNGTFNSSVVYGTDYRCVRLSAGDFNNDGDLDAVVIEQEGNGGWDSLLFYQGNGDGTFVNTVNYIVGQETEHLYVDDFNNDGNLDVASTNYNHDETHQVVFYFGNGDLTFNNTLNITTEIYLGGLFGEDMDKDGEVDIFVRNSDGVLYFENNLTYLYTSNLGLDVGSDADTEWSYAGEFSISDTFTGAGFMNELNSFLPACSCSGCSVSGGGTNCTISFNFSTDAPGILSLSDLFIEYSST